MLQAKFMSLNRYILKVTLMKQLMLLSWILIFCCINFVKLEMLLSIWNESSNHQPLVFGIHGFRVTASISYQLNPCSLSISCANFIFQFLFKLPDHDTFSGQGDGLPVVRAVSVPLFARLSGNHACIVPALRQLNCIVS